MCRINKMFNVKYKNMNKLSILLVALVLMVCGCASTNSTEKYQSSRDNVINVKDKIHEIDFGDVFMSNHSAPYFVDNYLIMTDGKSTDNTIFIFDKNDYHFITSTGHLGQGPGEIVNVGNVVDNRHGYFYVTDFGKYDILCYNIDSLLNCDGYKPYVKYRLSQTSFPSRYHYVNDTFSLGLFVNPTSVSTFTQSVGVWNMSTGDIRLLEYDNGVDNKMISLAVSEKDRIYAECNERKDLISLFDFDGNIKCNVFGPNKDKKSFDNFFLSLFTKDYLVAIYAGNEERGGKRYYCQVFQKNGDYVATLYLGYNAFRFAYDESNNRIVFCFNDTIQFGYLDLDEIALK